MPELMLRRDWPGTFRRTVVSGKKVTRLQFMPGEPVELDAKQIESIKKDIGVALLPCERDVKNRPRVITDDVVAEEEHAANAV